MKLNPIFSSNMVLAHSRPIVIFGEGKGNIKIDFCGYSVEKTIENDKWEIELPQMEIGGPYKMELNLNGKMQTLDDVYIGEVYLCSGQSNMQFKVYESGLSRDRYNDNNLLRTFATARIEEGECFFPEDGWKICKENEVEKWSLLGYLVGDEIAKRKNVPVGIITCYQGASVIESWLPKGLLSKNGIDIPIDKRHPDHVHEWFGKWNNEAFLYEFALKGQVLPYQVNAVLWYQGESDTSVCEGSIYANELKLLIDAWRDDFKNENLLFVIIQIADYLERMDEGWHLVQEQQLKIEKMMHNVKTIICRDVCENDDIHPKTKDVLAHRVVEALL